MKKFTTVAAMLAMVLVAAVPAYAQDATVEGDGDRFDGGDNSTVQRADSSQYAVQFLGEQNADQNVTIDGDGNAVGGINQQQIQYSDQTIQNAQADDGSVAFNVNDFDNDGIDDRSGYFHYFGDADFDGIADAFDYFVVFGDSDNDGVNDQFENDGADFGNVEGANAIVVE